MQVMNSPGGTDFARRRDRFLQFRDRKRAFDRRAS